MINGESYVWEDCRIVFDGTVVPIDGTFDIRYSTTREHMNVHGRGSKPVEIARGKKDFSGSIGLLQSALTALQAVVPAGKDITDLVYGITIAFAPEAGVPTVDKLVSVRFTEIPKGMGSDDVYMRITLPMVIGDIKYNV